MGRKGHRFSPEATWPKKGKKPKSTAMERMEWARAEWEKNPHIPINGKDGMSCRLIGEFGVTARDAQLIQIRQEVLKKANHAKRFNPVIKPEDIAPKAKELPPSPPTPPPPPVVEQEIDERPISEQTRPLAEIRPIRTFPVVPAPGSTRSADDAAVRYSYAREVLLQDPRARNVDIVEAVRERFGMGIDATAIGTIRRELGVGVRKRRRNEPPSHTRREPVARITHERKTQEIMPTNQSTKPEDAIRAAIQLLLSEVPGLRSLHLVVGPDGKPSVDFEVVATRSGKVQL